MKNFKVGAWETVGGFININAENENEAKEKLESLIANKGITNIEELNITHREIDVFDVVEISNK